MSSSNSLLEWNEKYFFVNFSEIVFIFSKDSSHCLARGNENYINKNHKLEKATSTVCRFCFPQSRLKTKSVHRVTTSVNVLPSR